MKYRCPICDKAVVVGCQCDLPEFFPFCCEKCKFVDLGKWFEENYKVISSKESRSWEDDNENTA